MPVKQLKTFLDQNKVKYVSIQHSLAYTAQEIAESAHIPAKQLAKTVIIKLNGKLGMVVLPANIKVDLEKFKSLTGTKDVKLASEMEFKDKFPGCEVGAMPPFGNLYGMDVFVEQTLEEDEKIAFNAGNHSELIQLAYQDFKNLVKPNVIKLPH